MSTGIYETRITHRYLMNKTKSDLALWVQQLHDRLDTESPTYVTLMGWTKYYLACEVTALSSQLPEDDVL